ncbi:MAG TPA: family 16 glycoside hydrolase, partial [Ktedonobacteraceae bacterium]
NLYIQATSRAPIFTDSLQLQTANQWQPANTPGRCNLQADALHTFSPSGSTAAECVLEAAKFTNFAFQVQVSIVQGNTAGLVFRADSLGHKQYLLGITTSGRYMLALTTKSSGSQPHVLASGISSVINQGLNHFNQLTIIARDSTLYLYINGQFITQVNDGTYSSGSIGLYSVDPHGTATEAVFDYLCIWSV